MEPLLSLASDNERRWAAELLAHSQPWIQLGVKHEDLLKVCFDREYLVFIAKLNNEACGVLILDPRGVAGSPYIKSIAVADNFRSLGIGSKMISFAESYCGKHSKHMFLCVSSFNEKARRFYARLGYVQVGEFEGYIIESASEILMHKRLE
jgi:[ribosomal protein S18]-alanine N-acetyltransferase